MLYILPRSWSRGNRVRQVGHHAVSLISNWHDHQLPHGCIYHFWPVRMCVQEAVWKFDTKVELLLNQSVKKPAESIAEFS